MSRTSSATSCRGCWRPAGSSSESGPLESSVSAEDLRALSRQVYEVDVQGIADRYAGVVSKVRDLGVALSDRRVVKILKLVAASAVLCGRKAARVSDFWVFRYVWDREEQIAPVAALVAGVIEPHAGEPTRTRWRRCRTGLTAKKSRGSSTRSRSKCRTTIARPCRHGEAAGAAGGAVGPGGVAERGRAAHAPDRAGAASC